MMNINYFEVDFMIMPAKADVTNGGGTTMIT